MRRETIAGKATVSLVCETFQLSRAAFYAEARRQRGVHVDAPSNVIALPKAPRFTSVEVVLLRIRDVLAREACAAWGVRKVWATLKREGLKDVGGRHYAHYFRCLWPDTGQWLAARTATHADPVAR